ncbi:MAG: hypothetical protein ACLU77_13310 [Waltera sp.]
MKILIIDDEYTIRHGIATVIRKYNERWTIVGEASDVCTSTQYYQTGKT